MRILFTVQAEGRGHMTQAIAVQEILRRRGHQLAGVLAGGNPNRSLPSFFEEAFDVPVKRIASPAFVANKDRSISLLGTGLALGKNLGAYRESLRSIQRTIDETKPDLIVNFLEPLMGLFNLLRRPAVPTLAVGHQFMWGHPAYIKTPEYRMQQIGLRNYVGITGARSFKLALSFYPAADLAEKRLTVCPPILRRQLFALEPTPGKRLLVYLVFHGFSRDIIEWSEKNPEVGIDCFYDKPNCPAVENYSERLAFHKLDGEKFLRMMAECRGVVCTAGFESVSEAAYLGKPILMVPVENHLEQFVNALDAEAAGLGLGANKFDLSRLVSSQAGGAKVNFKNWVNEAEEIVMRAIQEAAANGADDSCAVERAVSQATAI